MTRADCLWRLSGVALFGAAGLISLAHKRVAAAAAGGPPSGWEALLALASFLVATLGAVLVLNGVRLRDERRAMKPDDPPRSRPIATARGRPPHRR